MTTRAEVIAAARSWNGVPFLHQGRSRAGIDCAGLVIRVARDLGLSSFDVCGYRRYPGGLGREKIEDVCSREMSEIDPALLAPADVALFTYKHTRHLAIVGDYHAGGLSLIHAYEPAGKVAEVRFDIEWRARLCGAYALRGLD